MRKLFPTAITLCVLLFSCTNHKKTAIKTTPAFKQTALDSVYMAIRPAIQTFTINNSKGTRIKAANGTEVLVPADCFVTADGDKVENVQLEIVEAFSLPQFVTSGLATISDGKLLISNGMLYINAKSGEQNLQLKEGTALTVSMPTMKSANGFQLFTGDGDNWTVDSSVQEDYYEMPLPLDLLYPEGNNFFWYCIKDGYHVLDSNVVTVTNKKYENTVIATEAFRKRYYALMFMMFHTSYFENPGDTIPDSDCKDQKFNLDIWKVYFEHPNRSFKQSDSIAEKMYVDYFKANKEKIAAYCDEANKRARRYYDNYTDTDYVFDFRKKSLEEDYMEPLYWFPAPRRELKLIDDHGVNLEATNAYDQLVAKGVNKNEANEIMTYHFRRQDKIRKLQSIKDSIVKHNKVMKQYESALFTINKLGWINCDKFYDDPNAGKAYITVTTRKSKPLNNVDYSLVIPSLNVRLSAFQDSSGNYSFTDKEGMYTKLPIGREAVITGISRQHDSVFYASERIKISDGLNINLPMNYIKTNSLKDSLQLALKN
ncbi:hypothetical protein A3860_26875 [Niastella vici]|uniref:Uncharacterized protein n=1 Tax=Niastella vici TaxID=1703345 RepID=A0A1V9FWG4_9BACT|nr:hypothetical protein [Niastella vici]OQP62638.1 hypothetical protein A3860_26875 [Niastella vici]